jgi:hypothetical protein
MANRIRGYVAQRVRVVSASENIASNVAIPVAGYSVGSAIRKSNGKAIRVYPISASDLKQNGGRFELDGSNSFSYIPVYDDGINDDLLDGPIIPVYDVNGLLTIG